jgi:hypothetical protein
MSLDFGQIIKRVYDSSAERLKVDAAVSGATSVVITHTDDSIKIGDGTDLLAVNADGSINTVPASSTISVVDKLRHDYSSVNVTTGAYVQLIASTTGTIRKLEIFDSSGRTLVLATGAAASEVDLLYITPGGNGTITVTIASGTRLSIKAVSANATAGELVLNTYNG